ncbi:MAG: DUF2007 domain-containing protein [Alphaproteobacteria bacterium]|nr:DUF2007 domain-containing protein [Alphaproteobacteria bacterium]
MKEIIRANDPVLLSWVVATLSAENIEAIVLDTHTSILEGSVNALPRRTMVGDDDFTRARHILEDARPDGQDV